MAKGITLTGAGNAKALLSALNRLADEKEMRKHMRKGAKVIELEAQQNANGADPSGDIAKAVGTIDDPDDPTGVILTARRGKRYPKGYIAHIVEYGAAPHIIKPKKKGGKVLKYGAGPAYNFATEINHPGAKQHPFMRPAWDSKKDEAKDKIALSIKKQAEGYAKKYKNAKGR